MPTENQHYDAVIADLEVKRDQITSMIETLKHMRDAGISFAAGAANSVPRTTASQAAEIPHDAFFSMTLIDATHKYLSIVKQTKPHIELCDALLAGGFKTTSVNFREVVRATLSRHPLFVKVNGQWGLAEWYQKRAKRRPRRGTTPMESVEEIGRHEDQDEDEYAEQSEQKAEA
ncbi:MAG TPA: hypothetical protein VFP59_18240 [Candidatus Angelobacter sp.]|nr:hypothetical protein [Candidatus Angelobacter sp.]